MSDIYKEVRFDKWCPKCKYHDKPESEDPCCDCLDNEFMENSTEPVNFKEKEA